MARTTPPETHLRRALNRVVSGTRLADARDEDGGGYRTVTVRVYVHSPEVPPSQGWL
jgi:hypothetical protein